MQTAKTAIRHNYYGIALAYCTTLLVLMSLIIGFIQWAVGERKLGRRKTPPAATLVVGA